MKIEILLFFYFQFCKSKNENRNLTQISTIVFLPSIISSLLLVLWYYTMDFHLHENPWLFSPIKSTTQPLCWSLLIVNFANIPVESYGCVGDWRPFGAKDMEKKFLEKTDGCVFKLTCKPPIFMDWNVLSVSATGFVCILSLHLCPTWWWSSSDNTIWNYHIMKLQKYWKARLD